MYKNLAIRWILIEGYNWEMEIYNKKINTSPICKNWNTFLTFCESVNEILQIVRHIVKYI